MELIHPFDEPWLRATFTALHEDPELSGQEVRTSARVEAALGAMGIETRRYPGQTAVVGEITGGLPGPVVALRADMDALPILEPPDHHPVSRNPGVMHACGHDAHTSILLGAASLLARRRREMPGRVRLLFEHAEETTGGAREMIDAGCLRDPPVSAVLGLHVAALAPVGQVSFRPGPMSGGSDDLHITLLGRGAHGAYPQDGVDAIVLAAQVICALQTLISRETAPLDSAALTLGRIEGGTAGNVIAGRVELTGTLRCLTPTVAERLRGRIRETAQGICRAMGGDARVRIESSYPPLVNDPDLTDHCAQALHTLLPGGVQEDRAPSLGVESFAFFAREVPGFFYNLACGSPAPIHSADFAIDPACLALGARLQAGLALRLLRAL